MIDVPAAIVKRLGNPKTALWITEGQESRRRRVGRLDCSPSPAFGTGRGTNSDGGKGALPDWDSIALDGRAVVLAFDSDYHDNVNVYDALRRLSDWLGTRGAEVHFLHLPSSDTGDKVGLDDFLVANNITSSAEARAILGTLIDRNMGNVRTSPSRFRSAQTASTSPTPATPTDSSQHTATRSGSSHPGVNGDVVPTVAHRPSRRDGDPSWAKTSPDACSESSANSQPTRTVTPTSVIGATANRPTASPTRSSWHVASPVSRSTTTKLDADHMALNVVNGVIDLLHRRPETPTIRENLHSRIAGTWYDRNAECPRFEQFLQRIMPDGELRSFLQRCIGYSLTGLTGEQIMFLLIGDGANGKTTLVETVRAAMGDYAGIAAKDLLIAQRHEPHPTSTAALFRLRLRRHPNARHPTPSPKRT
jgi:hypothetical protein